MQVQAQSLSLTPQAPGEREKLRKAAQAFEAIFVRQMLSSARAASFGEGLFSSQATQTFTQMQDERFAEIAAQSGALGFAKVIEAQLARNLGADESRGPSTGSGRANPVSSPGNPPAQPAPVEGQSHPQIREP
jgi:flagellar protein FlgJ